SGAATAHQGLREDVGPELEAAAVAVGVSRVEAEAAAEAGLAALCRARAGHLAANARGASRARVEEPREAGQDPIEAVLVEVRLAVERVDDRAAVAAHAHVGAAPRAVAVPDDLQRAAARQVDGRDAVGGARR